VEGGPFVDGNRRTALLAGAYAHQLQGAEVKPEDLGVS
jgi:prophage maintenance system killer protein